MTQIVQVVQVILFVIPSLALLAIGFMILSRSVSILDRRLYLTVLIPLLLANTLTIFDSEGLRFGWRAWLILFADIILIAGAVLVSRGFQVYGLNADLTETILVEEFTQQGFSTGTHTAEKRDLWGRTRDTRILTIEKATERHQFSITARFNEVSLSAQHRSGQQHLQQALPVLLKQEVAYEFKAHAVGVLYIVLALVFAVLTWIFFFEPRLLLLE